MPPAEILEALRSAPRQDAGLAPYLADGCSIPVRAEMLRRLVSDSAELRRGAAAFLEPIVRSGPHFSAWETALRIASGQYVGGVDALPELGAAELQRATAVAAEVDDAVWVAVMLHVFVHNRSAEGLRADFVRAVLPQLSGNSTLARPVVEAWRADDYDAFTEGELDALRHAELVLISSSPEARWARRRLVAHRDPDFLSLLARRLETNEDVRCDATRAGMGAAVRVHALREVAAMRRPVACDELGRPLGWLCGDLEAMSALSDALRRCERLDRLAPRWLDAVAAGETVRASDAEALVTTIVALGRADTCDVLTALVGERSRWPDAGVGAALSRGRAGACKGDRARADAQR
jgi:hypothetical protein